MSELRLTDDTEEPLGKFSATLLEDGDEEMQLHMDPSLLPRVDEPEDLRKILEEIDQGLAALSKLEGV